MKPGRNEPCPCGSGKKYKKCCLNSEEPVSGHLSSPGMAEMVHALEVNQFGSLEEANDIIAQIQKRENERPIDDFAGLSPEQIHSLLYRLCESPQVITFPDKLEHDPVAPILQLLDLMVEAIGEKGLKATQKGNLPRAFVREAALQFLGQEAYEERKRYGDMMSETDFLDLNATRLIAMQAGLIRKHQSRFKLTNRCRDGLTRSGYRELYPILLRSALTSYNWAYMDRHPDLDIIQLAAGFTFWLLHRFGDTPRPQRFYEDWFVKAFPMAVEEVGDASYAPADKRVRRAYNHRTFGRMLTFLGLADLKPMDPDKPDTAYTVSSTALLDDAVRFQIRR